MKCSFDTSLDWIVWRCSKTSAVHLDRINLEHPNSILLQQKYDIIFDKPAGNEIIYKTYCDCMTNTWDSLDIINPMIIACRMTLPRTLLAFPKHSTPQDPRIRDPKLRLWLVHWLQLGLWHSLTLLEPSSWKNGFSSDILCVRLLGNFPSGHQYMSEIHMISVN